MKFDPLDLNPTNTKDFDTMTNTKLNDGRFDMIDAMKIIVQEQVTVT